MATQAWAARPMQPAPGIQQPPAAGPQGPWGPPGTSASTFQGPQRLSYGPPPGPLPGPPSGPPPSSYGQTPNSLPGLRPPTQSSSGSGGPLPSPPPGPPGSSAGMLQPGLYPPPPSMHAGPPYGPPVGGYPGPRWQPPVPGSTPTPTPQPVTGSQSAAPGSGIGPLGQAPPGPSQAATPVVSAPLAHPPYQQYSSGPGPVPQAVSPWMPPSQQAGPMQQRPSFAGYPSNFPMPYPGNQISGQDMASAGPPGGPYGSARDASLPKVASGPVWGMQGHYGPAPRYPVPSKDMTLPSNGRAGGVEPNRLKRGDSYIDQHLGDTTKNVLRGDTAEVSDAWTAHKTADGAVYYYNAIKGQSTYEKPPNFKGEAEKVTAQPTPVSWERLNGTDWALVTTNDGKKYYYNTKSQATSWQVPSEVVEHRKRQADDAAAKVATEVVAAPGTIPEKGTVSFSLNVPAAVTGGREAIGHKGLVPNSALDLIKRKLQDPGAPMTSSVSPPPTSTLTVAGGAMPDTVISKPENLKERVKGSSVDAVSSDSSSDSDEEDPGPSKEERIVQFKDMLKEKGIAPFSKWEKELPKVIFDVRFKAIPSHTERRTIFEHYVRTRADEERREKRAAQKAAIEGFKSLLDEAAKDFSFNTTYEVFGRKWAQDSRFDALDRRDRESLLNERILPLRKAEEERIRAEMAIIVANFKAMLVERPDISKTTRWSKVKDSLRNDPRYMAVKRDEREGLFNGYVGELVAVEQEAERAAKAKRDEEEKVKERERELRKRKEREELEMERVRVKARRKDAVIAYQALLTEKVKDPETSWTEARPKLEKDPLGRAANPELEPADRERFFREHTREIFERCIREYRLLLADVITVESASKDEESKQILTSWSEAKKILKPDPRYTKMPRRDRESWWRRYAEDVQRRMKLAATPKSEKQAGIRSSRTVVSASRRSPGSKRSAGRR